VAKNDRKNVNTAISQERSTNNALYGNLIDTASKNLNNSTQTANEQNQFLTQGYQDIYSRGGLDPTVTANLRGLNRANSNAYTSNAASGSDSSGGSGGSDNGGSGNVPAAAPVDPFATSRGAFSNFINTGGVDIGAMKEALGGFRDISNTGGYSAEDVSRIKSGIGKLEALGDTGGYDANTLAGINSNIGNLTEICKSGVFDPEVL